MVSIFACATSTHLEVSLISISIHLELVSMVVQRTSTHVKVSIVARRRRTAGHLKVFSVSHWVHPSLVIVPQVAFIVNVFLICNNFLVVVLEVAIIIEALSAGQLARPGRNI